MSESPIGQKLRALTDAFVAELPEQVVRFREAADAADRQRARDVAHRLAGSGGLHGFPELTAWGRQTQSRCPAATREDLTAAACELRALVARIRSDGA